MGNRIRHYREKKGLTQRQMESLTGITQQTLSALERAPYLPRLDQARAIAKALGEPLDRIFPASKVRVRT